LIPGSLENFVGAKIVASSSIYTFNEQLFFKAVSLFEFQILAKLPLRVTNPIFKA
jgi:hypothetical protein